MAPWYSTELFLGEYLAFHASGGDLFGVMTLLRVLLCKLPIQELWMKIYGSVALMVERYIVNLLGVIVELRFLLYPPY